MRLINSLFHFGYVWRLTNVFLAVCIVCSMFGDVANQQFYPNGRYGRRNSMPPLSDVVGGREMTVAFFGDGSVRCVHTGFEDYYKCTRKTDNRDGVSLPGED